MRHIAGLLEQGATSENARPYYNAELSALRQVVDAFDPPKGEMVGTGDETCGGAPMCCGPMVHAVTSEGLQWRCTTCFNYRYEDACTADAAEEGTK